MPRTTALAVAALLLLATAARAQAPASKPPGAKPSPEKAGAPTDGTAADSYFTTSAIITNGVCCDTNMVIDDNLLGGGAFTLYCEHNGIAFAGTSEVRRNHFTTRYRSTVGAFGPTSDCADEVTSGNVYDDGPNAGQPVPLD